MVRICDECNYGSYEGRCVICGGMGISDAFYCKVLSLDHAPDQESCRELATALARQECTVMEKDRDGCPKIVNLGRCAPCCAAISRTRLRRPSHLRTTRSEAAAR